VNDFPIVSIGASLGGVAALIEIVMDLSDQSPAAFLVTLHIGRGPSHLPAILKTRSRIPVEHARDGEPIQPGRMLVAPPDHHLLLTDDHVALSHGPRENWARPAIDPMFRSAAECCAERVIAVVLTGGLNDGTAGLYAVRRAGGMAIVQDPAEAEAPDMPRSALHFAGADYCLPLSSIGPCLGELTRSWPASRHAGRSFRRG
jgi:two-component system chemotaxis response regulator CheB